jgi:hypothetical protein
MQKPLKCKKVQNGKPQPMQTIHPGNGAENRS